MVELSFKLWPSWARKGWRKSALVNCVILVTSLVALITFTIISTLKGESILLPTFIFQGSCGHDGSVEIVSTVLSLLVNLISSGILASSSFFMQILNAPTRKDLDEAHARVSWLDIGIPSSRNAFRLGKWRLSAWLLLCTSSLPIHLLFNSTIFTTDNQRSDYHITIASEQFTENGNYYPPGASLSPSGLYPWAYEGPGIDRTWFNQGHYWKSHQPADLPYTRFGGLRNLTEYLDQSSEVVNNISSTARQARSWVTLNTTECARVYQKCSGLTDYRDVALITEDQGGWQPNQVWHLTDNQTEYWEKFMPMNESNHLWFSSQCIRYAVYNGDWGLLCGDTCAEIFNAEAPEANSNLTHFEFFGPYNNVLSYVNQSNSLTSGLVPWAADIKVKYCLAETVDHFCHIGISNILLLSVLICIMIKTAVALIITYRIPLTKAPEFPLVTIGDAISSFIEKPDPSTAGICTLEGSEAQQCLDADADHRDPLCESSNLLLGPRVWRPTPRRSWSVIPRSVWIVHLTFFILMMMITVTSAMTTYLSEKSSVLSPVPSSRHKVLHNGNEISSQLFVPKPFIFIEAVVASNSPQLLLAVWYLVFNNLLTRIQNAKEWASFAGSYQGLRVTDPKGDQCSTYRLQLPYKLSIPVFLSSTLMHWLMSQSMYISVLEGGYFATHHLWTGEAGGKPLPAAGLAKEYLPRDPNLPVNTTVALTITAWALIALGITYVLIPLLPIFLLSRPLPSTVHVGSNSFAISAASHVSDEHELRIAEQVPWVQTELEAILSADISENNQPTDVPVGRNGSEEIRSGQFGGLTGIVNEASWRREISQSKLRWGEVKMSGTWYGHSVTPEPVYHLGLGIEAEQVSTPIRGRWYA